MAYRSGDTICAPATIPGTGAISVIRLSGPDAPEIADKVVKCSGHRISDTEGYRVRYGTVYSPDGSVLDNVLASVFRAPHSYTGEDSVEISCHASSYIVSQLLQYLINAGARAAGPGEFTQRAFMNGKMDLSQAEAVADVISSGSEASHRIAMNQLRGGISRELGALRDKLLKMTSLIELELDFSEEDVEFASRSELAGTVDGALAHIGKLTSTFSRGNAIKNGVPVAIAGATNTGKSTLLNAILGEDRAIVSDIAGTTRDTVEETFNLGGILFRFIDTAGIRETWETVERIGIERTFRKLDEASIILCVTDLTRGTDTVLADARLIVEKAKSHAPAKRVIILLNKCDLVEESDIEPVIRSLRTGLTRQLADGEDRIDIIPISAKTGQGLERLNAALESAGQSLTAGTDETVITNIRHYEALVNAAAALRCVREALGSRNQTGTVPPEFIAQDLREALHHLGSILGEVTTDEILGSIFKNFCVGK